MEDDSFDDMPKLIRYMPERAERPPKPQLNPIDVAEANRDKQGGFGSILKKPTTSDIASPVAVQKKPKEFDISDKQLSKIEKTLKVQKFPRGSEMEKAPISPQKNVEKSKTLITQMVNKISTKNVAEELLPISTQNITKLTRSLDEEKTELAEKAQNIEQQLRSNPHNKNLQKQLQTMEMGMERLDTMKLLYLDKVELRNENRRLLGTIEQLKKENKEIKAKIAQGIQQIEAHMHNLPCDKEKALEIEIRKCQEELKSEREMRTNLEKNISNTIQNFARLYEEADIARKIVVSQLKQIEQSKLRAKHEQEGWPESDANGHMHEEGLRKRQDTKTRKREDSRHDPPLSSNREREQHTSSKTALKGNHTNKSSLNPSNQAEEPHRGPRSRPSVAADENNQRTLRKHDKQISQPNPPSPSPVTSSARPAGGLEDMVQRMRANQSKFRAS